MPNPYRFVDNPRTEYHGRMENVLFFIAGIALGYWLAMRRTKQLLK